MNCPHGVDPFAGDGCTMALFEDLAPMVSLEQRRAFGRVLVTLAEELVEQQERAIALRVRMLAARLNAIDPLDYLKATPAPAARRKARAR